ncbi:hypothetical protein [Syntrophomonas curvata]
MLGKPFFFYAANINPLDWKEIFLFFTDKSNNFVIHFPEGEEGFLNKGISVFKQLLDVNIKPWEGMKDSIEISGKLTRETKDLFVGYQTPAFNGEHPELWDFQYYLDGNIALYIGDFCDCVVYVTEEDMLYLEERGIDWSDWQETGF